MWRMTGTRILRRQPAVDGNEEIDIRLRTTKVARRVIRQEDAIRPGLDLRVGKTMVTSLSRSTIRRVLAGSSNVPIRKFSTPK